MIIYVVTMCGFFLSLYWILLVIKCSTRMRTSCKVFILISRIFNTILIFYYTVT